MKSRDAAIILMRQSGNVYKNVHRLHSAADSVDLHSHLPERLRKTQVCAVAVECHRKSISVLV